MTVAPWPVAIVTGMLGSGKTTLIRRLLQDPATTNTLVLVNEFGEVGLDHLLLRAVTDEVVLLPNGCLCCTVRSDVVQTLSTIRRDWLAGRIGRLDRVLIETSGLAEPAPLVASLVTHPMLSDAFVLETVSTIVDGEHGPDQLARNATCRNQIRVADHLFVSKLDRIDRASVRPLGRQLRALNPLARVTPVGRASLNAIFNRATSRLPPSMLVCDETSPHLEDISTVVLRATGVLDWIAFRNWLATVLDECGDRLLRLKGCLSFDAFEHPVVLQAVHHAFYPLVEATGFSAKPDAGFLLLIIEGSVPSKLVENAVAAGLCGRSNQGNWR